MLDPFSLNLITNQAIIARFHSKLINLAMKKCYATIATTKINTKATLSGWCRLFLDEAAPFRVHTYQWYVGTWVTTYQWYSPQVCGAHTIQWVTSSTSATSDTSATSCTSISVNNSCTTISCTNSIITISYSIITTNSYLTINGYNDSYNYYNYNYYNYC